MSRGFLAGLAALLLNDFVLKQTFGNAFTGKLSDFAGLLIFPFFFASIVPSRRALIYVSSGVAFCIWKSPLANVIIDFVNGFELFTVGRTIDYTDLVALSVLPLSFYYFNLCLIRPKGSLPAIRHPLTATVAIVSVFAFTATTRSGDRSVHLEREYSVSLRLADIKTRLTHNPSIRELRMERETDVFPKNEYPDVETSPDVWFASFSLDRPTCDSKFPEFHFVVTEVPTGAKINPTFVKLYCPDDRMTPSVNAATKRFQSELLDVFEREVIHRLSTEADR